MKQIIWWSMVLFIVGCSNGDTGGGLDKTMLVYISNGHTQCNNDGVSYQDSLQTLVSSGIDVIETQCGVITGLSVITVCGAPTLGIIIHRVKQKAFTAANEMGYNSLSKIAAKDRGVSYQLIPCVEMKKNIGVPQ